MMIAAVGGTLELGNRIIAIGTSSGSFPLAPGAGPSQSGMSIETDSTGCEKASSDAKKKHKLARDAKRKMQPKSCITEFPMNLIVSFCI
jgi:hypothetical protein